MVRLKSQGRSHQRMDLRGLVYRRSSLVQPDLQLGTIVKLTKFAVDDSAHNSDGLLLHGWDGDQPVTGFISRRVMDDWVDPRQPYRGRQSRYRDWRWCVPGARQGRPGAA